MKKTFTILAFVIAAGFCSSFTFEPAPAEELSWNSWNKGYPKIRANNKIGLIDVYTDWCGWCKRMDRDTYSQRDIIDRINKDFVPIKFNPEMQGTYYLDDSTAYSGPQLYMMLCNNQPSGYPTTYFLIPKNNVTYVQIVAGYQNAEGFAKTLDQIKAQATDGQ